MKPKVNVYIKTLTSINPTEDPEKVIKAVKNIFPFLELEIEDNIVVGYGKGKKHLEKLKEIVWKDKRLDYSRMHALNNMFSDMIILKLNKQAALAGKVCFADTDEESPMGAIQVIIETDNPELLLDWLFPATEFGKPKKIIDIDG